ncbi:hypothetical protein Cgig2_026595 [Carnegiea gigantea]|uniref:Uncharacterized protein n=1 Tax=Carnegiea gigantea TaxID=171969 RepID=A0A9Q1QK02_9CARY|nr:hypothetical protein Cgig2_026595 [Carnegiea gigantea]
MAIIDHKHECSVNGGSCQEMSGSYAVCQGGPISGAWMSSDSPPAVAIMEQGGMNPQETPSSPPTMRTENELQGPLPKQKIGSCKNTSGTGATMEQATQLHISTENVSGRIRVPGKIRTQKLWPTALKGKVEPTERNAGKAGEVKLDTSHVRNSISITDVLKNNALGPANLVKKWGKAIERNECQQDYSSKLLEIINAFPRRCGCDLAFQHRDLISIWERVKPERIVAECLNCMAYCCLFPEGFAIEGDELVQLWMAVGLIEQESMELFAAAYLSIIQDLGGGFISLTREDNMNGEKWYKLNDAVEALPITNAEVPEDHFHELVRDRPLNLDSVSSFGHIRTLLLLKGHRSSHIDRLPYDFFMSLELLRALDLSGTKLSELPSSIGGARFLRYLNLSETLIQRLPETVRYLPNLQTLKLRNCPRLLALPKAMRRVTTLQHLDLGTLCDLCSMPPQMGSLTRLCTLSNFIVAREFGCGVGELKNLNNLKGRICLSRLENVGRVDEAKEAQLQYKKNITKLELRWTDSSEWDNVEGDNCEEEEVIQHLQPPKELQHLEIICYGGSKFPTWISLPWFDKLTAIVLFKCENCQLLPSLGQLPSLESLTLIELVEVKIIDSSFCVETTTPYKDDFVAFPKLQRLEIKSMLSLEEWRHMGEVQCFPSVTDLVIKDCPQLVTLCRLSQVCCLKYLEINCCGRLPSLPKGGLPDSAETFVIDDCPLLNLSCNKSLDEQGWHKTEHGLSLLEYHRVRSCLSTSQETSTTSAS